PVSAMIQEFSAVIIKGSCVEFFSALLHFFIYAQIPVTVPGICFPVFHLNIRIDYFSVRRDDLVDFPRKTEVLTVSYDSFPVVGKSRSPLSVKSSHIREHDHVCLSVKSLFQFHQLFQASL